MYVQCILPQTDNRTVTTPLQHYHAFQRASRVPGTESCPRLSTSDSPRMSSQQSKHLLSLVYIQGIHRHSSHVCLRLFLDQGS